jgi:hypothetical protein
MDAVEFSLRIFAFNDDLPKELAKLEAEGWKPIPGLAPAVSYVVFRPQPVAQPAAQPVMEPVIEPASAGMGIITIDDSKVHLYRNGRLVGEGNG